MICSAPVRLDWPLSDIVALSLVAGLPRAVLFAMLRGEAHTSDTAEQAEADGGPHAVPAGPGGLEALVGALGRQPAKEIVAAARRRAERAMGDARRLGIDVVAWPDARYPPLVARISDPPLALWVRGSTDALCAPAVAIVGSRGASAYGEDTASRLATDLAARGIVIVSGLARGIDAAAHRGALAGRGRTVAVLGCGVDIVYPPEHASLLDEIAQSGAVVSEFSPGSPPLRYNFPRRNRIISALSCGVVVVEARQRSGALITADCALEQGREVMAVPGSVLGERHRGSHTLLKAGATLVETAEDVLQTVKDALPGGRVSLCPEPTDATVAPRCAAGPEHGSRGDRVLPKDELLRLMEPGEGYAVDVLASMSGQASPALLSGLLELELEGRVQRLPGGRFVRRAGTC